MSEKAKKRTSPPKPRKTVQAARPPRSERSTRYDYERAHERIRAFTLDFIRRYARVPTAREIAQGTGFSQKTVERHRKELRFEPFDHALRTLNDDVLLALFLRCKKGSVMAIKLWFQIMEAWHEPAPDDGKEKGLNEDELIRVRMLAAQFRGT